MDDFDDTLTSDITPQGSRSWQSKGPFFFMLGMGAFLLACLVLLVTVFMYLNTSRKSVGAGATDKEGILLAVGKMVDLPSDEAPQLAPINDIAPFKNQPFFARARLGDVLIVYTQNHLAVLYSPEENKIMNMSKISVVIPRPAAL